MEVEGSSGDTLDCIVVVRAKGMFSEPQLHHKLQVCPIQALRQLGIAGTMIGKNVLFSSETYVPTARDHLKLMAHMPNVAPGMV